MAASAEGRAFGVLVRRLRGEMSQLRFADQLSVSRSLVANTEIGRIPGPTLLRALLDHFPEHVAEIERMYQAADTSRQSARGRQVVEVPQNEVLRRVLSLRRRGRFWEAEAALRRATRSPGEVADLVAAWEQLGQTYLELGDPDHAIEAYRAGIETADSAGLESQAVELRELLAGCLVRAADFDAALALLDEGLSKAGRDPRLWRRRGHVLWYAHRFPDAYTSLTTALNCGCQRVKIFHARGQVLAEWGQLDQAIGELSIAIDAASSPTSQAYARSTRAYALAASGDFDYGMSEFARAESVTPNNAWLHYFRARCYDEVGVIEQAHSGFVVALQAKAPMLNRPKRDYALDWLQRHESQCSG